MKDLLAIAQLDGGANVDASVCSDQRSSRPRFGRRHLTIQSLIKACVDFVKLTKSSTLNLESAKNV